MKLTDLEPQFLKIVDELTCSYVDTLAEAQGISFLCPVCFLKNNGRVGTHSMHCWFNGRGVPPSRTPGPGRWNPAGTGYADLSFIALQKGELTSVKSGEHCHFHIENGEVKIC